MFSFLHDDNRKHSTTIGIELRLVHIVFNLKYGPLLNIIISEPVTLNKLHDDLAYFPPSFNFPLHFYYYFQ